MREEIRREEKGVGTDINELYLMTIHCGPTLLLKDRLLMIIIIMVTTLVFVQLVYDGLKTMILKHHPAGGGSRVGPFAPLLDVSMCQ